MKLCVLASLLVLLSAAHSSAQRRDRGLELATAVVHEAGFEASRDEIAAIHAVIVERCDGSVRCQMPRFARAQTSRPWTLWLRRDARRPWLWPARVSWAAYVDRWLAILATADAAVRGEVVHSCEEPPQFWGCRDCGDQLRAQRLGLIEVQCSSTPLANAFYVNPRRAR